MLRTNMMMQLDQPDSSGRVGAILVTSAAKGEGKSTVCANLAVVLAQLGRSVALVDADLRLPSQARIFGAASPDGMVDYLLGDSDDLEAFVVRLEEGVDLYSPSEPRPESAAELVASAGFDRLTKALTGRYDVVVIDTAPVGLVTDAAIVAPNVSGVMFVVSADRRGRKDVDRSLTVLRRSGARVIGCVLNRSQIMSDRDQSNAYYISG